MVVQPTSGFEDPFLAFASRKLTGDFARDLLRPPFETVSGIDDRPSWIRHGAGTARRTGGQEAADRFRRNAAATKF
jgi:hypothetical protein